MSTKRIVAGTLVSYLNTGISMASNFILVPMYLYYLGKEQYGLWIVVLSIVSYLGLSNLGIAQIVSNLVASANSKRDYAGIKTIVATGFWLYIAIVSIVIVLVVAAAVFAPIGSLFKVTGSLARLITPGFCNFQRFFSFTTALNNIPRNLKIAQPDLQGTAVWDHVHSNAIYGSIGYSFAQGGDYRLVVGLRDYRGSFRTNIVYLSSQDNPGD